MRNRRGEYQMLTRRDNEGAKLGNSLSYVMLGIGLSSAMISTSEVTRREPAGRHQAEETRPFLWPNEKRAAVSLSFDDARASQVDTGLALLNEHHVKVTFFVQANNISHRVEGWKKAVADGHEIGNHSMTHPCTGNYAFSRHNALEDYSLQMMAAQLDEANSEIQRLLGVKPRTFAYPCGQKFVG